MHGMTYDMVYMIYHDTKYEIMPQITTYTLIIYQLRDARI